MKNVYFTVFLCAALFPLNVYAEKTKHVGDVSMLQSYKEPKDAKENLSVFDAAWKGNLNAVKTAVEKGAKLEKRDPRNGATILMAAASSGNGELVKYLVSKGSDVKAKHESGETALHYAAWKGNFEISKFLVEKGAPLNAVYYANGGLTPLSCAVESGNNELVKYLISKGANTNIVKDGDYTIDVLWNAADHGNFEAFKYISGLRGASFGAQQYLIPAIRGADLKLIKYLAEEKRVNVNARTKYDIPIEAAAKRKFNKRENQSVEILKYLVSKGAKLSDINKGKIFPWALGECEEPVINYFLEQGIKYDAPPRADGWTPLATALGNGSFTLAKSLLGNDKEPSFKGAPLVVFFADGITNSYEITDFLIKNGVNKQHYSQALGKAVNAGDVKTAQLLLNAGADINAPVANGLNALAFARSEEMADMLIKRGIKTNDAKVLETAVFNFPLLKSLDKAKINIPVSKENANKALLDTAGRGNAWAVNYFISKGADVNFKSAPPKEDPSAKINSSMCCRTALIENAIAGYEQCVYDYKNDVMVSDEAAKILIKAGADVNIKDGGGKTALHHAAGGQRCVGGRMPIPMGDRRQRDAGMHGDRPARPPDQRHDLIVGLLIKSGAKINETDAQGNTPLLGAAKERNYNAMRILLKAGADANIKNADGKTVFDFALDNKAMAVLKEFNLAKKVSKDSV